MKHRTSWPVTVREAAEAAAEERIPLSDYLKRLEQELGPMPMPPAGYVLAPGSDDRWLGPEILHRKWIITPVWNYTTDTHSLDVWLAEHYAPTYAALSPADALELAADLAAAAQSAAPGSQA